MQNKHLFSSFFGSPTYGQFLLVNCLLLEQTQVMEKVTASTRCTIVVSRLPFIKMRGARCETVSSWTVWPGITLRPDTTRFRLGSTCIPPLASFSHWITLIYLRNIILLDPSHFILNLQTWRTQLQPVIVVASVEDSEIEAGKWILDIQTIFLFNYTSSHCYIQGRQGPWQ